jgi:hypothetical protein
MYTINEITRLGLLLNYKGEPYKNAGTVSRIVNKLKYKTKKTPWGLSKCLTMEQIKAFNKANKYE